MDLSCKCATIIVSLIGSYFKCNYLINEYISRDDATTSKYIIGGTIGEALLPIVIGHTMSIFGARALLYDTLIIAVLMVILYIASHFLIAGNGTNKKESKNSGQYYSLPTADEKESGEIIV